VTHDAAEVLPGFLASLRPPDGEGSPIVVVDNGSRDGTRALLAERDDVTVIEQGNTGYAHAVNRGIEATPVSHDVLVLNPDLQVSEGAIGKLSRLLDLDPTVGIAVPALTDASGRIAPSLRREPGVRRLLVEALVGGDRSGRFGERFAPSGSVPVACAWATGAAMLVRRETLDAVGPLSEAYFLYSEETEYCLRLRDAGWRVVCDPAAVMVHTGGDMATNPTLWALRSVNQVRLANHRGGRLSGLGTRLATILFELRRVLTGKRVSREALRVLLWPDLEGAALALTARLGGDPTPMVRQRTRSNVTHHEGRGSTRVR
jgi:N-acetylglucosaminyl-diphospho-decaprenol L-rhamnosyltransferase